MLAALIALFVGLGGGTGIATLVNAFLNRKNERTKVEIDEEKFTQDSMQQIIENLWRDNDVLRVSDQLKTEKIHALEREVDGLKTTIRALESRFSSLEKGYNGL